MRRALPNPADKAFIDLSYKYPVSDDLQLLMWIAVQRILELVT